MKPIELRIYKYPNGGHTYYVVDKVWPGVGNVGFGRHKFMTAKDAVKWCKQEWHGVPVLRNY